MGVGPRGRVVVVAASAGGLEALRGLLSQLPAGFPAALLVVLHVPAAGGKSLPGILSRAGPLPARTAVDGERPTPGHVFVAPPDNHLLMLDGLIRLSRGPRSAGHRPAADPLLFSVALSAGPQALAVVLSGTLEDGAAGCAALERRGGSVLVQDPAESHYSGMPMAAINATKRALILPLSEIAMFLGRETRSAVPDTPLLPDRELERRLSIYLDQNTDDPADDRPPRAGNRGGATCPQCGRLLEQDPTSQAVSFKCAAGHLWPAAALADNQAREVAHALRGAVTRLEERARLSYLLADAAEDHLNRTAAAACRADARAAQSAASVIRELLDSSAAAGIPWPADDAAS
ncbi:MAG TPA: chemotaxis protein CheB [Streptosporangiaceae bacterium]|nr:chemotaxis protein CheB [Streptosporangiaceae bacterium]